MENNHRGTEEQLEENQYKVNYGNNDDSSQKKIKHRKSTHDYIAGRPRYKQLK